VLTDLIRYASGMIRSHTQRQFTYPVAEAEQRALWFSGQKTMALDDPIANITEIIAPLNHFVDGEPFPIVHVLTAEEYSVLTTPIGNKLRLAEPGNGRFDVTADWGWAQIPGDVQYAAIATVDEWYRSNIAPAINTREQGEQEGRNIYLPREVQESLENWRLKEYVY
jgi:hypothetical protein